MGAGIGSLDAPGVVSGASSLLAAVGSGVAVGSESVFPPAVSPAVGSPSGDCSFELVAAGFAVVVADDETPFPGDSVVLSDFLVEVGFFDVEVEVEEGAGVVRVSKLNLSAHSFRPNSSGQHHVLAFSSAAQ